MKWITLLRSNRAINKLGRINGNLVGKQSLVVAQRMDKANISEMKNSIGEEPSISQIAPSYIRKSKTSSRGRLPYIEGKTSTDNEIKGNDSDEEDPFVDRSGNANFKNSLKYRQYFRDIEAQTGVKIGKEQRRLLADELRKNNYSNKLSREAQDLHRKDFNNKREGLIKEWEEETGQSWPRYEENIYPKNNPTGIPSRKAGGRYDAHHIIESSNGGPNKWWNIHPARYPDQHQGGIHRAGGLTRDLFE